MNWITILVEAVSGAILIEFGRRFERWSQARKEAKAWEYSWTCALGCELTMRTNNDSVLEWLKNNHLEDRHGIIMDEVV